MGKVKNWAWDSATKFLETIQTDIEQGILTNDQALLKMQNTDEMMYYLYQLDQTLINHY